jgi:hypothetical protein
VKPITSLEPSFAAEHGITAIVTIIDVISAIAEYLVMREFPMVNPCMRPLAQNNVADYIAINNVTGQCQSSFFR